MAILRLIDHISSSAAPILKILSALQSSHQQLKNMQLLAIVSKLYFQGSILKVMTIFNFEEAMTLRIFFFIWLL